jgi:hypothetical protein
VQHAGGTEVHRGVERVEAVEGAAQTRGREGKGLRFGVAVLGRAAVVNCFVVVEGDGDGGLMDRERVRTNEREQESKSVASVD